MTGVLDNEVLGNCLLLIVSYYPFCDTFGAFKRLLKSMVRGAFL
jgi:hypothetical protein